MYCFLAIGMYLRLSPPLKLLTALNELLAVLGLIKDKQVSGDSSWLPAPPPYLLVLPHIFNFNFNFISFPLILIGLSQPKDIEQVKNTYIYK
jgi:hypothetical protein